MKIVVFSDIHGNLSSLNALCETDDFKTADKVVFLGDVVIGCSQINECIEQLQKMGCECLLGNNDYYVCYKIPDEEIDVFSEKKIKQIKNNQKIISEKNKEFIKSWKKDLKIIINKATLYFTHYPWESFGDNINIIDVPKHKSFQTRCEMFQNVDANYIFFGHEHLSNYFTDGSKNFYCVGTLGLEDPGSYLLITYKDNKVIIVEKHINSNLDYEKKLMNKDSFNYIFRWEK